MTTTNSHPCPGDAPSHYCDPAPVLAYVRRYLDQGWTIESYAQAAGITAHGLNDQLSGQWSRMRRSTARKLLAVNDDLLYEAAQNWVPVSVIRWQVGSLCAIGYSCPTLADMLGYDASTIVRIVTGAKRRVTKAVAEDIAFLHDKIRNVPGASPNRSKALALAARYGFHRPEEYAPDGTLWEAEVRDETIGQRWDRRDREAWLHMEVARLSVKLGKTLNEMQGILRMFTPADEIAIRRARRALGLKWSRTKEEVHPLPGQEARIAEILAVVERWIDAGPTADAWPYCLELGMMDTPLWNGLENKPMLVAA